MAKKPGRMADKGRKTVARTDAELAEAEVRVLRDTEIDWEELRPFVTGQDTYDALVDAVRDSTRQNESLAQLKDRLTSLGERGVAFARKIVELSS